MDDFKWSQIKPVLKNFLDQLFDKWQVLVEKIDEELFLESAFTILYKHQHYKVPEIMKD